MDTISAIRTTETRRLLLLCFTTIKTGKYDRGICSQVWQAHRFLPSSVMEVYGAGMDDLMRELFRSWPKYSGDSGYPIPSPHGGSPSKAYYSATNFWSGEYGDLRKDLLVHCLNKLRNGV